MLKKLPRSQRPQERLERLGATALTDKELLAMLVRKGTAKKDVLCIADEILNKAGTIAGLLRWEAKDFEQIHGVGKIKGLQLSILLEIAKRMMHGRRCSDVIIDEPKKVWSLLFPELRSSSVEKVWVLCLDRKNKLIRSELVTSGTATKSLVHPREVLRPAIRHGATGFILAHNHPSGDPTPSTADLRVTKIIHKSSLAVEIEMYDHVIIGEPENCSRGKGYYSFADAGSLS